MDWKNIVTSIAPAIGTAIGGPAGGLALSALGRVLLGDENATEEDIAQAVTSMPPSQLALEIKQENDKFQLASQVNAITQSRVNLENTTSAREMYKKKEGGPQALLSYILVVGFFVVTIASGVMFSIYGEQISKEAIFLLGTLLGSLGTFVMTVIKFWFGGKPDDEKTMDRIYNAIPGKRT